MKLSYSPESIQDLIRVREFIAQTNPQAARRIAAELIDRIKQLCAFPDMGRAIEQPASPIQVSLRDFSFGNYIVRYACYPEAITILRIWHHYENRN